MCSQKNDRLAAEITELASHIHAATCRWLGLVAEFDRRGGWGDWGAKSCAHWLSWRCQIGPVAAREHVRVAHRLDELPLIRGAFAEGRLSYSQVRALTRVENIVEEVELLSLARHATASQLERLVRAYRGVVARAQVAADGRGPERYVTWDHADDGSLLLRARLPAEEGAVVLAAIQAAVERMSADASAQALPDDPGERASAEAPAGERGERASAEAPARERGERASAEAPAGEPGGRASAEAPAGERGERASAEAIPDEDVSAEALEREPGERRIDASAEALAAFDACAEAPSVSERRADALVLMADTLLATESAARGTERYQVLVHLDATTLRDGDGDAELADGTPLAPETARRIACDSALVPLLERAGRPLGVGRKTRSVPAALRRALSSRDRGCRFPGCANSHAVDAHHIEHWARGGATNLDNLVQLCRHHHRLLHEGGYSVTKAGPAFIFRRPDGRQIRPVPRKPRGSTHTLRETNRAIEPEATVNLSSGERMDLALSVDAMLAFAPLEAPGI